MMAANFSVSDTRHKHLTAKPKKITDQDDRQQTAAHADNLLFR